MVKKQILKGLAGAAALAGATQAYGAVVNLTALPTNIPGNAPNGSASTKEFFDVDTGTTSGTNVAGSDLEFGYLNSSTYNEFFTGVYGLNGGKALAYAASSGTNYAYGPAVGTVVGTGGPYAFNQTAGQFTLMSLVYNGTAYGIQKPDMIEYLGFQFAGADGQLHDGWLELESDTYQSASNPGGLEFLGGAYNTTPDAQGGTIMIGQMAAVPEPGTLSMLALGAAGLVGIGVNRRRKAAFGATQA